MPSLSFSSKYRGSQQIIHAIVLIGLLTGLLIPQSPAYAAAALTITPLTWNIVGLDSNSVTVGPNDFPIGARVCNTGDAAATSVTSAFVWDTSDAYINLRPGTLSSFTGANAVASLAAGSCTDFYYEVEVTRDSAAYNRTRNYHITASADSVATVSTPTPRQVFVERLISQNRNSVTDVKLNGVSIAVGGTMTLLVGQTYTIQLIGNTATQGYEQIESFINFPNTIFQVLSAVTTYSAESSATMTPPYDKLYGDACVWENDLNSPNYRACNSTGKAGGSITVTYQVKILQVPGAPLTNPQPLSTLIYDFSGSSYHYNSDYGISTRYAYVMDPSAVTISKNFSPDPTNVGGVSALTFTLTNPTPVTVSGLNFTDTFPISPGAMTVAAPLTTANTCGGSLLDNSGGALAAGDPGIRLTGGTLAANSNCTISVNVTVPTVSPPVYTNTSAHLFIGTIDTGNFATDTLTVNSAPAAPAPVCGLTMAQWTFAGFTTIPPPFPAANTQSSAVATATISVGNGLSAESDTLAAGGNPQPGILTYGWQKDPPIAAATSAYIQFAIDTSNFTQVNLLFDAQRKANGPNNDELFYSTDGTTWTSKTTFISTTSWATYGAYNFTGQTNTTGLTYFRIYGYGANATSRGNDLTFDNVTFTGCSTPTPPTLTKVFAANPIVVNGTSTLNFTLTNSNSVALTGVTFTDSLPSGVQVAGTPAASTTCSGTPTWAPAAAATTLTFGSPTGGTIPANSSCTVQVNVTATTAGPHDNVSGFISSTESGINTTSTGYATASLTAILPPSIAKAFAANPILAGSTSTLTFTITNPNQNDSLTGLVFTDTFPTSPGAMTVASPLTTTNSCGGTLQNDSGGVLAAAVPGIRLTGGTLAGGSTCTVTVNVTAPTAGSYVNTSGAVSSTNGGSGNTASKTLSVTSPNPAIALLKQVSTSASGPWTSFVSVTTGSNVYYQFTIENTGDVPLSPVSVTDPLVSTASCTWPASLPVGVAGNDNHIATCVVGPVTAVSGSHTNTATASGTYSGTPYTSTPSSARYATTGLTIAKSVAQNYFTAAGNVLNYSFVVTNSGSAPLLGPVTVSDDKATDESCPAVSTVGDLDNYLDAGESITCTASYTVLAADVTGGSVTNAAFATVSGFTSNTDAKTVNLAAMTIDKNTTTAAVNPNGNVSYTIAVVNTGGVVLTNFQLTDTLPDFNGASAGKGYVVTSVSAPGYTVNPGFNGDSDANLLAGTDTIAVGATATITINLTLSSAALGAYDNTAAASTTQTGSVDDDGLSAQDSNTPAGQDPEDDEDVTVTRTITLRKSWVNAIVNDAINMNAIRSAITIGTLASTANTPTEIDASSSAISVNVGDLVTFSETFTTGLAANYTSAISCAGAVDIDLSDGLTVNAADSNIVCTYANTRKSATLTLQKTWVNAINGDAVNIPVTTGFTNNTTALASTSTGNNTTTGAPVTVYAGETGALPTETFTAGSAANYSSILGCTGAADTNLANGLTIDSADTAIVCTYTNTLQSVDLSLDKQVSNAAPNVGNNVTFTLVIANAGPSAATNINVTDVLPSGYSYVAASIAGGDARNDTNPSTSGLTWTINSLASGASVNLAYQATVLASGTYDNYAEITSHTQTDSDSTPNNASTTEDDDDIVTVTPLINAPSISKNFSPDPVTVGGISTLTFTIMNPNAGTALTGVGFTDSLPAGLEVASTPNASTTGCSSPTFAPAPGNTTLTFTGGGIAASGTCTVTVDVTATTSGTKNNTSGNVSSTNGGTGNTASDTLTVALSADLGVTKTDGVTTVVSGGSTTYTITLTNNGPSAADGAAISDPAAAGLTKTALGACTAVGGAVCPTAGGGAGQLSIANLEAGTVIVPTLPSGGGISFTVTVDITAANGNVTNTFSAATPTGTTDPTSANNAASDTDGLIFDPPTGIKTFTEAGLPQLEFRMVWINSSNTTAINVQVTDNIPAGTTYVAGSLTCAPQGTSLTNPVNASAPLNTSLSSCAFDSTANRIQWQGTIGPDNGNLTEATAANEVVITFRVTVNNGVNQVFNQGFSATDIDSDGNFTEETVLGISFVISNQVVWNRNVSGGGSDPGDHEATWPKVLPSTGFAPNTLTALPAQPMEKKFASTDVRLEIPNLGVNIPVVGVPLVDKDWDVSWLWKQAGWLEGTAFPGWNGNSVLTGHVYLPNGKPGPFVDLSKLKWGDKIIVRSNGYAYEFQVRENLTVSPGDISVLKHEQQPWVTLLTCKSYDEATNTYAQRIAVRAKFVKVTQESPEKSSERGR